MWGLELATFNRDAIARNPAAIPLIKSYLHMRLVIGVLGLALPILLVVVDQFFLDDRRIRGSMSAYYHSSARDLFVGGLVSTGIFLMTYMSAKRRTYDYLLSTLAGFLVLVVAFFPTGRAAEDFGPASRFGPSATSCTDFAGPPACSGIQAVLGEHTVELIHRGSASTFVILLALLCWVWSVREAKFSPRLEPHEDCPTEPPASLGEASRHPFRTIRYLWNGTVRQPDGRIVACGQPRRRALMYLAMAGLILVSALWAVVGVDLPIPWYGEVGPTYAAEFVAFEAFGAAWIAAAWDLMPERVKEAGAGVAETIDKVSGTQKDAP